ncbi:MAG: hypothetical protein K0S04_1432 [Herbinix sp.]|jgi:heme exporter protein D|nr:hypothetical protein [Herbinix sp.]
MSKLILGKEKYEVKKIRYIAIPMFLLLNAISSAYYLYMGRWKNYVWLFGVVEILLTLIMLAAHISVLNHRNKSFTLLSISLAGVLCMMQVFPLVGAFFIYPSYSVNGYFHLIIIALGLLIWREKWIGVKGLQ